MGEYETAAAGLMRDQRGVIYVELVLLVAGSLIVAGMIGAAGAYLLALRFDGITEVLYSGSP